MPTKNNRNIEEHYRGNEEFVKRLCDLRDRMESSYRMIVTPFLTPLEQDLVERVYGKGISYALDGGYDGAQRRCLKLFPPYAQEEDTFIVCLKAGYPKKFGELSHRDVLGALMSCGIKREQTGDILIQNDAVYLFCLRDIANYICCSLTSIKRFHVSFHMVEEAVVYHEQLQDMTLIVSSLRLDCMTAALGKISRSDAVQLIRAKHVKVNHLVLEETSYVCNNNSVISIRGHGRFLFRNVIKTTKKDRFVIDVGKYL